MDEKRNREEDELEEEEAVVEEQAEVRIRPTPATPSKEEKERHDATHGEYRSWCIHCVRGRGLADAHKPGARESNATDVAEVVLDYCFPSQEDEACMKILATRDRASNATAVMVVPTKGYDEFVMKKLVGIIRGFGHHKFMMKSDGERPIRALKEAIKVYGGKAYGMQILLEESPKGQSPSNGAAEKLVQDAEGMIRTWKDAVEHRIGERRKADSVLMPYLVRHAGTIITRCRMGPDGLTPQQRLRGKKPSTKMIPFGEKALYMPLRDSKDRANKLEARFEFGIWAGISDRTGEYFILTPHGQVSARTIRRLPEEQKWNAEYRFRRQSPMGSKRAGESKESLRDHREDGTFAGDRVTYVHPR